MKKLRVIELTNFFDSRVLYIIQSLETTEEIVVKSYKDFQNILSKEESSVVRHLKFELRPAEFDYYYFGFNTEKCG